MAYFTAENLESFCNRYDDPSFGWVGQHPVDLLVDHHLGHHPQEALRGLNSEYAASVLKILFGAESMLISKPEYVDTARNILSKTGRISRHFSRSGNSSYESELTANDGSKEVMRVERFDEFRFLCQVYHQMPDESFHLDRFILNSTRPLGTSTARGQKFVQVEGENSAAMYNLPEGIRRLELITYLLEKVRSVGIFNPAIPNLLKQLGFMQWDPEKGDYTEHTYETEIYQFLEPWLDIREGGGLRKRAVLVKLVSDILAKNRRRIMDSGTVVDKVNDTILKNRAYYPFSDFDTGRHKGVELLSINELAGWLYTSGTGNKGLKCANIMRQRKGPNTIKVSGIRIGDLLNKPMIDVEYPCHGWSGECMFTGNCALNEGLYLREEQQKRIIDVVLNLTSGNPFFYREVPDLERGDLERWENVWFID